MTTQIINIPDLGEAEDVEVIEICVKTGDIVDSEAPILVLESDKAAMEIPASIAGTVISLKVLLGDKVGAGTPFLEIEVPEEIRPLKEEVIPAIEPETSKKSKINPPQETNVNTLNEYMRKDKKIRIATSMNSPIHMFFKFGYIHSINDGFSSHEILDDKCYIITDEFKKEISID